MISSSSSSSSSSSAAFLFPLVVLVSISTWSSLSSVETYKNLTVGDSLGWYDNTQKPHLNYQKWAAANNFSLGDFLIFNTDTNHSVIQTSNATIYKQCDYEDAAEKDTIEWSSADPSNTSPHDVSVAVPLLKEGITYFFSSDYDGEQCKNGQHFQIIVTHGQGLPKNPESQSQGPAGSPQSGNGTGDDEPTPDTIVPGANFNNPKQDDSDDEENGDKQPSRALAFPAPDVLGCLVCIVLGLLYVSS